MTEHECDDLDDNEFPDENGDDDEALETRPCPNCGAEIYEEAEQCPSCGEYVTFDSHPLSGRPKWWILLGLIGMAAVIYGLLSWSL